MIHFYLFSYQTNIWSKYSKQNLITNHIAIYRISFLNLLFYLFQKLLCYLSKTILIYIETSYKRFNYLRNYGKVIIWIQGHENYFMREDNERDVWHFVYLIWSVKSLISSVLRYGFWCNAWGNLFPYFTTKWGYKTFC